VDHASEVPVGLNFVTNASLPPEYPMRAFKVGNTLDDVTPVT
jgi:hypothetical protein